MSIRVPENLAQRILEIARELDKGYEGTIVINTASGNFSRQRKATQDKLHLSEVKVYRSAGHKVIRLEELARSLSDYLDSEK